MKFQENGKIFEYCNIQNGIYFLLKNDEVVYIGKSTRGFSRIGEHKNKDFNKYAILEIKDKNMLNFYESKYILKYQPKYNGNCGLKMIFLSSAYNSMNTTFKRNNNIFQFKEKILNFKIKIFYFKNNEVINKDDFSKIKEKVK